MRSGGGSTEFKLLSVAASIERLELVQRDSCWMRWIQQTIGPPASISSHDNIWLARSVLVQYSFQTERENVACNSSDNGAHVPA